MEKKYIVKDFEEQTYYCGEDFGWSKESYLVETFNTLEDAENFIKKQNGKFQTEVLYFI